MTDQVKKQLANALNVDPDKIHIYHQTGSAGDYSPNDEYTVILDNYQKFVRVVPQQPEPAAEQPAAVELPDALQQTYRNPGPATKTQLVKVCKALGLSTKGIKGDLIDRIRAYRQEHTA